MNSGLYFLSQVTQGWIQDTGDAPLRCCTWALSFHLHRISFIPTSNCITAPDNPSSPIMSTEVCLHVHSFIDQVKSFIITSVNSNLPRLFQGCRLPLRRPTGKAHTDFVSLSMHGTLTTVEVCSKSLNVSSLAGLPHPCVSWWFQTLCQQSAWCHVSPLTSSTAGIFLETEDLYGSQSVTLCLRIPPPHTQTQPRPNGRMWSTKKIPQKVSYVHKLYWYMKWNYWLFYHCYITFLFVTWSCNLFSGFVTGEMYTIWRAEPERSSSWHPHERNRITQQFICACAEECRPKRKTVNYILIFLSSLSSSVVLSFW